MTLLTSRQDGALMLLCWTRPEPEKDKEFIQKLVFHPQIHCFPRGHKI